MSLVPANVFERPLTLRELALALMDPVKQMLFPEMFDDWEQEEVADLVVQKLTHPADVPEESMYWRN
jgi:hypothetical protein